jgi:microcystin-dependent protein
LSNNFRINTNKFTVDNTGNITAMNNFDLSNNFRINTNKFTIDNTGNVTAMGNFDLSNNFCINNNQFTVDNEGNITAMGSLDLSDNFRVNTNQFIVDSFGNVTATNNLFIGNNFDLSNNFRINTNKFTVDNTGNITAANNFDLSNNFRINTNKFTVDNTGNITAANNFDLSNNFRINTNKFTIDNTGNITAMNNFDLSNNFRINTNKFTVNNTGYITSAGSFDLSNNFRINTNKFTVDNTGNVTAMNNFDLSNNFRINTNKFTIDNTGNITAMNNFDLSNNFRINKNKFTVDNTGNMTAMNNFDLSNNFRINTNKFTVDNTGNMTAMNNFDLSNNFRINTNKFTVDNTGNMTAANNFDLSNNFRINTNKFTVDNTGNMTAMNNFDLSNNFRINTNKFTVDNSGNMTSMGNFDLSNNFRINTDRFTVDSQGNVIIKGTISASLGVASNTIGLSNGYFAVDSSGNIISKGSFDLSNNLRINTNKFTVDPSGNITAANNFDLSNNFRINTNKFTVDNTGNITAANNFDLSNNFRINTNKFTIDNTGNITSANNFDLSNNFRINTNKFTVDNTGQTYIDKNVTVGSTLFVNTSTSQIGINNLNPIYELDISGNIRGNNMILNNLTTNGIVIKQDTGDNYTALSTNTITDNNGVITLTNNIAYQKSLIEYVIKNYLDGTIPLIFDLSFNINISNNNGGEGFYVAFFNNTSYTTVTPANYLQSTNLGGYSIYINFTNNTVYLYNGGIVINSTSYNTTSLITGISLPVRVLINSNTLTFYINNNQIFTTTLSSILYNNYLVFGAVNNNTPLIQKVSNISLFVENKLPNRSLEILGNTLLKGNIQTDGILSINNNALVSKNIIANGVAVNGNIINMPYVYDPSFIFTTYSNNFTSFNYNKTNMTIKLSDKTIPSSINIIEFDLNKYITSTSITNLNLSFTYDLTQSISSSGLGLWVSLCNTINNTNTSTYNSALGGYSVFIDIFNDNVKLYNNGNLIYTDSTNIIHTLIGSSHTLNISVKNNNLRLLIDNIQYLAYNIIFTPNRYFAIGGINGALTTTLTQIISNIVINANYTTLQNSLEIMGTSLLNGTTNITAPLNVSGNTFINGVTDISNNFHVDPFSARVGINNKTPQYNLDISGNMNLNGLLYVNNVLTSQFITNGNNAYYNIGNIAINKTTPTQQLDISGSLIATNILIKDSSDNTSLNFLSAWDNSLINTQTKSINFGKNINQQAQLTYVQNTNNRLSIGLNNTEILSVVSNGNVGINKSNPIVPLDVNGTVDISGNLNVTSVIYSANRIGIKNNSPSYELDVNGDINYTGKIRLNGNVLIDPVPVGMIMSYISENLPPFFLKCDGSAISRTLYSDLFTVIGTAYGVGDGSTTFNLPDLRSKDIIGSGQGTSLSNRTIGTAGGEETHILNINEIPSHNHNLYTTTNTAAMEPLDATSVDILTGNYGGTYQNLNANSTQFIQSTGGTQAHNNMHPYLVCNYIIKVSSQLSNVGIAYNSWLNTNTTLNYTSGSVAIGKSTATTTLDVSGNIKSNVGILSPAITLVSGSYQDLAINQISNLSLEPGNIGKPMFVGGFLFQDTSSDNSQWNNAQLIFRGTTINGSTGNNVDISIVTSTIGSVWSNVNTFTLNINDPTGASGFKTFKSPWFSYNSLNNIIGLQINNIYTGTTSDIGANFRLGFVSIQFS